MWKFSGFLIALKTLVVSSLWFSEVLPSELIPKVRPAETLQARELNLKIDKPCWKRSTKSSKQLESLKQTVWVLILASIWRNTSRGARRHIRRESRDTVSGKTSVTPSFQRPLPLAMAASGTDRKCSGVKAEDGCRIRSGTRRIFFLKQLCVRW